MPDELEPTDPGRPVRKNRGGRPSKLTEEVFNAVMQALRAGNYQEVAARYAGISESTYWSWLERGKRERERIEDGIEPNSTETIYREFLEEVEQARAAAEVRMVGLIATAAKDTWQAAAWYLERSKPNQWGRRDRHEITGRDGAPVVIEHHTKVEVSIDRAAAILAALDESGVLEVEGEDVDVVEGGPPALESGPT